MGQWQSKAEMQLTEALSQANFREKERIALELKRMQEAVRQEKEQKNELQKQKLMLEAELEKEKNGKSKEIVLDFQKKFFEFINKVEESGRSSLEEITEIIAVMSPLVGETGNLTTLKMEGLTGPKRPKAVTPLHLDAVAQKNIQFQTEIIKQLEFESSSQKVKEEEPEIPPKRQEQSGTDSKQQLEPGRDSKQMPPISEAFDNEYELVNLAQQLYEASVD